MLRQFLQIAQFERRAILRRAFVNSLPVLMGYTTMGFAAGVLLSVKGGVPCAPAWSFVIAALLVSGTMSFAIVPAMAASESFFAVALLTLGINFRYALYGFSMLAKWKGIPVLQKWFLVHSLADEIYALDLACTIRDPLKNRLYCLFNHAFCVGYWVLGSVAGSVAGSALPIPSRGIEFAMVALFLVIFTDQMKGFFRHYG